MTAPAAALALVALLPQQPGSVHGVIRSSDGGPVAYANVELLDHGVADWTDAAGEYHLPDLPGGRWRILVVHPNHDSLTLDVFVPGDRGVALDLTLQARPGPAVDALADFEPFQVEYTLPALLNTEEVTALIRGQYPPDLASRGVGGETILWLWLDERGIVVRSVVSRSSGQPALDSVAGTVANRMRFRAARNRDDPVRVIVQIPVMFTIPEIAEETASAPGG